MRTNLKWNLRLCVSIFVTLTAVLVLGFSSLAAPPPTTPQSGDVDSQSVLVPVILDGIQYTAEDFNVISGRLKASNVDLIFAINPADGHFYAFTTVAGYNEFAKKNGLPSYAKPDSQESGIKPVALGNNLPDGESGTLAPLVGYAYNYENIDYGGAVLSVARDNGSPDLRQIGWNDVISSVIGPSSDWPNGPEILYEDIYYGGSTFFVYTGQSISSLVPYGWNDRTSSLMFTSSL